MNSFARMILSLFALVLVLAGITLLFSPQVRTAFFGQPGESQVGQLRADAHLNSDGRSTQSGMTESAEHPADARADAPGTQPMRATQETPTPTP